MKVLLIYPPQVRPVMPHLALPLVKAELEEYGIESQILDVNILFYKYVLDEAVLNACIEKLKKDIETLETLEYLEGKNVIQYYRKATAIIKADYIIQNLDRAKNIINTEEFYDFGKYLWAFKIVEDAIEIFSGCYGATDLGFSRLRMKYSTASSSSIYDALSDTSENPFIEILPKLVDEYLLSFNPDYVGITFSMDEQLIPGFTLAKYIKEKYNTKLIAGGGIISRLFKELKESDQLSSFFEYYPFASGPFDFIKNKNSKISKKKQFHELIPCFDDFDLDSYYISEKILPFELSVGCSFAKCFYCNHYKTYGGYKYGNAENAVNVISKLKEKFEIDMFYFVDEDITPKYSVDFSKLLIDNKIEIKWMIFARLQNAWKKNHIEICSKAGVKRFLWGLDSVTERIQNKMNKFTNIPYSEKILKWANENSISNQVNFIVGFPGESKEESQEIINFTKRNKPALSSIGSNIAVAPFSLVKDAAWDKMDVTYEIDMKSDLALYYKYDSIEGLNMQDTPNLSGQIQSDAENILGIASCFPRLREFAFLYSIKYSGNKKEDIPKTLDFGYTEYIKKIWLKYDLFKIRQMMDKAKTNLKRIPEQFLSDWYRLENCNLKISYTGCIISYKVKPEYTETTFETLIESIESI